LKPSIAAKVVAKHYGKEIEISLSFARRLFFRSIQKGSLHWLPRNSVLDRGIRQKISPQKSRISSPIFPAPGL